MHLSWSKPIEIHAFAGSDSALLAPQLCNQLRQNTYQAALQAENIRGAKSALPSLAPKHAGAYRQLGEASELRRVPRPRFRLANQRPTATRRSLLNDFDAVENFSDDGSMHLDDDYSCSVSSLIKAHAEPGYHSHQLQQQLRDWCLRKHSSHAGYQVLQTQVQIMVFCRLEEAT